MTKPENRRDDQSLRLNVRRPFLKLSRSFKRAPDSQQKQLIPLSLAGVWSRSWHGDSNWRFIYFSAGFTETLPDTINPKYAECCVFTERMARGAVPIEITANDKMKRQVKRYAGPPTIWERFGLIIYAFWYQRLSKMSQSAGVWILIDSSGWNGCISTYSGFCFNRNINFICWYNREESNKVSRKKGARFNLFF